MGIAESGEYGVGSWGQKLWYKGCRFHLIRPGMFIQGGDIVNGNGSGGDSIYGPFFDDENFDLKHKGSGMISMATGGPNSNTSQFYINLNKNEWLDDKSVVFGRVIGGKHILGLIAAQGRRKGPPKKHVWISDCDQVTEFEWYSESPYMRSTCPVLDNIPSVEKTIFYPLNLPKSEYRVWDKPLESIDTVDMVQSDSMDVIEEGDETAGAKCKQNGKENVEDNNHMPKKSIKRDHIIKAQKL